MSGGSARSAIEILGALLRERRVAAGLSLRELSHRTNVSNAYLSELERGRHEPSLTVLRAIASALETPLAELLGRAGMLGGNGEGAGAPGAAEAPDTEAAIERDPRLTEAQRIALLSVYRSFVQSQAWSGRSVN